MTIRTLLAMRATPVNVAASTLMSAGLTVIFFKMNIHPFVHCLGTLFNENNNYEYSHLKRASFLVSF